MHDDRQLEWFAILMWTQCGRHGLIASPANETWNDLTEEVRNRWLSAAASFGIACGGLPKPPMKIWRFRDSGDIHYVFAIDQEDARRVFYHHTGGIDCEGWDLTEVSLEEASTIHVKDEDDVVHPTTLGAIYQANSERGYVCGSD